MTHVLQLNSSIFSDAGASSRLADAFVARLRAGAPGLTVARRDLAREPLPHLDAERFAALTTAPADRGPRQAAIAAESDRLVAELVAADPVVVGAPMYNFSVPTQLKAWFDHVARARVTFRYTPDGPEGLLAGRRAVVFGTRGGIHEGHDDVETPFVRRFLGLLGIDDVRVVNAQGLALGDDARARALAAADDDSRRLAAELVAAARDRRPNPVEVA